MQGSLSEFRLAEILQLVAVQQKTGLLRLGRHNTTVVLYFDNGVLVSCRDRRHVVHDQLFQYLARTGYLQPEALTYLRDRLESSKEDLADVLLGERFLNEEELQAALEDLAQELVHLTFTWREGTYQFVGGEEALSGLRHRLALKIDAVLMEGARRADEWPRLVEKLPGPEVVVDLVQAPTSFGPRAFGVLSQLTGVMRLGELVGRARVPEFEVYEIVAAAVDAGAVRIVFMPEPAAAVVTPVALHPSTSPQPAGSRLWSLPRPLGWTLALGFGLLSAFGVWVIAPRLAARPGRPAIEALAAVQARDMLRRDIALYHTLHGRYPASLIELTASGLASPALLRQAAPLHYVAELDGSGYRLSDLGAVSPPGTQDGERAR